MPRSGRLACKLARRAGRPATRAVTPWAACGAPWSYRSRMPGGRGGSFVLRRMGSSRLLLASILLAVLVSSGLAAALITFGLRTLPAAAQSHLASSGSSSIQISAQVTLSQEQADGRAIAALLRSALGPVPVTLDNA